MACNALSTCTAELVYCCARFVTSEKASFRAFLATAVVLKPSLPSLVRSLLQSIRAATHADRFEKTVIRHVRKLHNTALWMRNRTRRKPQRTRRRLNLVYINSESYALRLQGV
jgi:uncharacterized C2H2 Zn-finger protein